jgi:hypothetical protein
MSKRVGGWVGGWGGGRGGGGAGDEEGRSPGVGAPVENVGVDGGLQGQAGSLHQELGRREGQHAVGAARPLAIEHSAA